MSAHTPGPWTRRDMPIDGRYIGPANDGGACSIAFVLSAVSRSAAELDANARLIAAAPELLQALTVYQRTVEAGMVDIDLMAAHELAHAAIAKAEGV